MLILARKENEKISIGDGLITITVVEVRGNIVRLGLEAPQDVRIYRQEVQLKIDAEKGLGDKKAS